MTLTSISSTPYSLILTALTDSNNDKSDRSNLFATELYGLQLTHLPVGCIETFYNNGNQMITSLAPTTVPKILANVQYLYENGIINWPNFTVSENIETDKTVCLPNCGLCTSHSGDSVYYIFNLLVIGVLLPIVGMCGIVGNSLSAYVYSRKSMRKQSTNVYLCALGCSDNSVILTALFLFFIDSIKRHSATLSVVYGKLSPYIYPAGMMAQTCSVYFTLAAGFSCFLQVCFAKKLRNCCKSKYYVQFAVVAVLLFSILYNVPHLFEAILIDCWHPQFLSQSVDVCPAPFRFNPTYMTVYYKYMYSIFLAVGPLIVLIVLNSFIILLTVYQSKRRKVIELRCAQTHYDKNVIPYNNINQKVHVEQSKSQLISNLKFTTNVNNDNPQAQLINTENETSLFQNSTAETAVSSSDDNIALILVVLLFICCNVVALLINVFETNLSNLLEWRINYIIDISNLLVVFNSSFNIIIYYNFSMSFRKIFQKEFCIKKYKFFQKSALLDSGGNNKTNLCKNIGDSLTGNKILLRNGTVTTTISASTSENDAANNRKINNAEFSSTALTKKEKTQTAKLNKCNKVAYSVLFESSNNYRNSNKNYYTKPSDVASINSQQNSDKFNSFIEENLTPRESSYKIGRNIIEFPLSSLCKLSEKSFDTDSILNKLFNVVESPHSITKFKDYNDEDIQEYMDSCSEIIHSSPHNLLRSKKCLNNCTNCYNNDNSTLEATNNATTKHSKIQSIYVSNYIT